MHAVFGLVLGWLPLATAQQGSVVTAPASDDAEVPQASVDLDLGGLEPIDPGVRSDLAKAIHAGLAASLARSGFPNAKVHVDVAWRDPTAVDYAVRIHLDAHGGARARDQPATTGPDASTNGLAEVVAAALERALDERSRELVNAPTVITTPDRGVPDVGPPPTHAAPRPVQRALGPKGWAGVGLAIAGAAGVAVGGGLVGLGAIAVPGDAPRLRDWRPAGWSLLAIGGASLVGGTVMAVVDARSRRNGRVSVRPWGSRRGAGVAMRVWF